MSPRAACWLERLGFSEVYHYVGGKDDWLAAGLPREGESAHVPNAGDIANRDVRTCRYDEDSCEVSREMQGRGEAFRLVLDDTGVLLGEFWMDPSGLCDDVPVADVMTLAPKTTRANRDLDGLLEWMEQAPAEHISVTDPDGRLIGLLSLDDVRNAVTRGEAVVSRR